MHRRLPLAIAATLGVAIAAPVHAAPPAAQEREISDDVDRPIHDLSAEGDASSMVLNPALLSAAPTLDIALLGYQALSQFARGSGFGAFIAANLRFGLAMGFGAQFVQPRLGKGIFDFAEQRNPPATKFTWALSGGLGDKGSFGLAVHGLRSEGQWLRRPDLDLGTMIRIRNYGSVGVVARLGPGDLRDADFRSQASLSGELALRPLGTRTLELAGGLKAVLARAEPGSELDRVGGTSGLFPRGRIAVRHHGIALLGEVEQVGVTTLDPDSLQPLRQDKAVRGSVALELGWDFVRARAGLHAGLSDGVDGLGFEAHFGTRRNDRVYWPRRVEAERIDLAALRDEADLVAMLERLERARRAGDRSVLVVYPPSKGGWATMHELREALIRVRDAGGHVFAYVEAASLPAYYVASAAEKIYIHPAGSLDTWSLASTQLYFRDVLAKLGVRAEVAHIAEYKSAGEAFTEQAPTAPDREQKEALLSATWQQVLGDVARARALPRSTVRQLLEGAPHAPTDAVEAKLVDEVVFRDQLLPRISDVLGTEVELRRFDDTAHDTPNWAGQPYVGVVLVEGTIIDGESRTIPLVGVQFVGGDTIARTLRELREDPACEGIVLRVNSGGGSALASDVMWREVKLTAEAHARAPKFEPPIVVSMGDVAGSGGYYVAMGTDTVFADPLTITGSIGVISIHPDVSGLMAKLGVDAVTLSPGKNLDPSAPWRPWSDDQRARIERSIASTYDLFRTRVADARGLTPERVHELGRGHVYDGRKAQSIELVDTLGGLHEAIAAVRAKAGVPRRTQLAIRVLPERRTLVELLLGALGRGREPDERGAQLRNRRGRRTQARPQAPSLLPPGLELPLVRAALPLLWLEPGQAQTLMPWTP
ncbi:MAG: signal peptide peptidase SppA [Nannocystaceae bacterium]|nr:signal peptide peptidase SppA [Nannocystaceae bacterium]